MLADRLVDVKVVRSISAECVRTRSKKRAETVAAKAVGDPAAGGRRVVCAMEDVLEVYQRPYDPQRPLVCLDETSKQLVAETRTPIPAAPGQPERVDYEYERQGTANLFMIFEPLAARRRVKVTERRTAMDFAPVIRELVDEQYPQAEKIVLVMDHLNTTSRVPV